MADPGPLGATPADAVGTVGVILVLSTIVVFFLPILILFPPVPPTQTDYILQTHRRVGLEPSASRLARALKDAARRQPSSSSSDPPDTDAGAANPKAKPTIRGIFVRPIISCRGIELSQAQLLPSGLQFDRLFAFAQPQAPPSSRDAGGDHAAKREEEEAAAAAAAAVAAGDRWRVVSRRELPRLAGLEVELFVPDIVKAKRQGRDELAARAIQQARAGGSRDARRGRGGDSSAFLIIRFPWRAPGPWGLVAWLAAKLKRGWLASPERELVLPVDWPEEEEEGMWGVEEEVVISGRRVVKALNLEAQLPPELRLYLGVSTRLGLFRVDAEAADGETGAGADRPNMQAQDHVQCALHLLNLSSIPGLDEKRPKDGQVEFLDRTGCEPNIFMDGSPAYEEESWHKVTFRPEPGSKCHESTYHVQRGVPDDKDDELERGRSVGVHFTPAPAGGDDPEDVFRFIEVGMSIDVQERREQAR